MKIINHFSLINSSNMIKVIQYKKGGAIRKLRQTLKERLKFKNILMKILNLM